MLLALRAVLWWLAEASEPRPEQTVARLQMVIEKRQWTVGGKRCEPQ
jgi:hypothetical protein